MVDYRLISVIFMCLIYALEMYIQNRQYKLFRVEKIPKKMEGEVTPEQFLKTQRYNADKAVFSFAKLTADLVSSVLFYFYVRMVFDFSAGLARRLFEEKSAFHVYDVATCVTFTLVTLTGSQIFDAFFSIYRIFSIEQRHGFNNTTPGTFLADQLKTLVLKSAFTALLVPTFCVVLHRTGKILPFAVWLFFFGIKLLFLTIYPTFIQPCFNRVEFLRGGPLREAIEGLAQSLDFPLTKIYTIDGSRRSAHSNAYLYGFCSNKRIVLYDTLIEQCNTEQILAVLAHELGHWALSHTLKLFVLSEAFSMLTFWLMYCFLFSDDIYSSFAFDEKVLYVGVILFFIIYSPLQSVFAVLTNSLIRLKEYEADDYAKKLGKGEKLKEALLVLEEKNLSSLMTDWLYSLYHDSHPPVRDRISRLKKVE